MKTDRVRIPGRLKSGGVSCRFLLCSGCGILAGTESLVCEVESSENKALEHLRREDLLDLIEIYAKNWLAMDGEGVPIGGKRLGWKRQCCTMRVPGSGLPLLRHAGLKRFEITGTSRPGGPSAGAFSAFLCLPEPGRIFDGRKFH